MDSVKNGSLEEPSCSSEESKNSDFEKDIPSSMDVLKESKDPNELSLVNELIENNLGKRRWKWLEKQGCIITKEYFCNGAEDPNHIPDYEICTNHREYIGLLNLSLNHQWLVKFIYKHKLTKLMNIRRARGLPLESIKTSCSPICVGYSETEKAWYGWTHRGYGKFFIGYKTRQGSIMDHGNHKYPYEAKTDEDCRQLACDISEYLD
jgi:hypothetical protein